MLYIVMLNLYNVIFQLYLNKAGGRGKNKFPVSHQSGAEAKFYEVGESPPLFHKHIVNQTPSF